MVMADEYDDGWLTEQTDRHPKKDFVRVVIQPGVFEAVLSICVSFEAVFKRFFNAQKKDKAAKAETTQTRTSQSKHAEHSIPFNPTQSSPKHSKYKTKGNHNKSIKQTNPINLRIKCHSTYQPIKEPTKQINQITQISQTNQLNQLNQLNQTK